MKSFFSQLAPALAACLVLGCHTAPVSPARLPDNYHQLSTRISCSAEPETESAFAALQAEGIKTIVSVDGGSPDVKTAKRHGMRYIHVPIGYDGVPAPAIAALDQVVRQDTGRILVHCHHGKHRGPSAAAIACMLEGTMTKTQALHSLETAGTGKEYTGLWRDVRNFAGVPHGVAPPPLKAKSNIEPFAADMVAIDHAFDALTKEPAPPSTVRAAQATLLLEGFKEAQRHVPPQHAKQAAFLTELEHMRDRAQQVRADAATGDTTKIAPVLAAMKADCRRCHHLYRD